MILDQLGGIDTLLKLIGVDAAHGLNADQVVALRAKFGTNSFPEAPMKGFFQLFFEAFQDPTQIILISAAIVSLILGVVEHGAEGWIEGAAILIAVFIVATVTAGNDYTKELQFRALEATSQRDERCSVLRNGAVERINPVDLVIGDIIVLQV